MLRLRLSLPISSAQHDQSAYHDLEIPVTLSGVEGRMTVTLSGVEGRMTVTLSGVEGRMTKLVL